MEFPEGIVEIPEKTFYSSSLPGFIFPSTVISIGTNAFEHCNIPSISIPGTVENIGDGAFADSSIPSVVIEEGVTALGDAAFAGAQIEKITLPASVKTIGKDAFKGCMATLFVPKGSYAEQYCKDNNISYQGTEPGPVMPSNITVSPEKVKLIVGQTQQPSCVIEPADADQSVTYRSDNNMGATVSKDGLIIAIANGSATITVKTFNGKAAKFNLTVIK